MSLCSHKEQQKDSPMMLKEKIFLEYREGLLERKVFLQKLREVDEPKTKQWKGAFANVFLVVLSFLVPFGFSRKFPV